jgi:two-component system, NarL family, response regulator NreC
MKQRVLIVDDHDLLRAGIHALLNDVADLSVIGEAANGQEAISLAEELSPDLILLDISLPDINGLELAKRLLLLQPRPYILLITVHEDKVMLQESLSLGVSGYILKRATKSELVDAIQAVMRGEIYVHPALTRYLFASNHEGKDIKRPRELDVLTDREVEVLCLLANGYSNRQIADQLYLSVRTVESHRANLISKLDLHTRLELVRYARKHNLIPTEKK